MMLSKDFSIKREGNTAKIFLFPKQEQFIKSECDEVLYGGAAGGGKSRALLYFALQRRLQYPKSVGILFRRTFPELERSLIQKSREFYPMFGGKYNDQKHRWIFPNGAIQEFGHLENEKDVYDYQSAEYQDICFDEASHFTEFMIAYLMSRCRSTIPGCKSLIRMASNPGGVGHGYLKRRFIDPYQKLKIWDDPKTIGIPGVEPKKLTFIPARLKDNPALMENDPGYVRQLKSLPEKKRLALEEGRWDVYDGQFFSEWNTDLHVLRKRHTPSPNTQKIIHLDWGYAEPAAVYWTEITPSGRVFTYREHYVTQRSPKELARDIMDLTPAEEEGFRGVYLPPELFGKKIELEDGGVPIADLMSEVLRLRFAIHKANNARIAGWTKMREYLAFAQDGLPWWQISPNCENLIRTLPEQVFDDRPGHEEDLDNRGEDHAVDGARYGLMALNQVPRLILTPHGVMDTIFGRSRQQELSSSIQMNGRSGYGH